MRFLEQICSKSEKSVPVEQICSTTEQHTFHTNYTIMVKTKHPTSTASTTSPHQTRSKSPRKKKVDATERRTSPRVTNKTKKVRVDTDIGAAVVPPSSVGAAVLPPSSVGDAPPPLVGDARSKKLATPRSSSKDRPSSLLATGPLPTAPRLIDTGAEVHPPDDADIGKPPSPPTTTSVADTGTASRPRSTSVDAARLSSVSSIVESSRGVTSGGPLSRDYMESVATAYLSSKKLKIAPTAHIALPRLSQAITSRESKQPETSSLPPPPPANVASPNDDASLFDDEDNEAEVKGPEKKNFHEQEDVILSMAWVNHTSNSITGTDQDGNEFWNQIFYIFQNAYVDFNLESLFKLGSLASRKRNAAGLRNRFMKTLHPRCKKFTGCYDTVSGKAKTGNLTDTEILKEALELFRLKNGNKKFTHMESWKVLQHCPAFVSPRATTFVSKKAKPRKETVVMDEEESLKPEGIPNSYDSTALVGPIYGRDKSKRMEKLDKEKESKEFRDRKIINLFDEQGKELKTFAKILGNRASQHETYTTKKPQIDVTLYHENIKLLQSLGQKKKAEEMLLKVTDYLMCQEMPSSTTQGSEYGMSHQAAASSTAHEDKSVDSLEEIITSDWKKDASYLSDEVLSYQV